MRVVDHVSKVVELENTVSTRKYPFVQETLDKIRELRHLKEDELYKETGEDVVVPAPIIIKEAVDRMHEEEFGK